MATLLYDRIYTEASRIPPGSVMSYGNLAKQCGLWRGARLVGWALRTLPPETQVPWHRVVNRNGQLSIQHMSVTASEQRHLLEQEGVVVEEKEGVLTVPLHYMWKPEKVESHE